MFYSDFGLLFHSANKLSEMLHVFLGVLVKVITVLIPQLDLIIIVLNTFFGHLPLISEIVLTVNVIFSFALFQSQDLFDDITYFLKIFN